MLINLRSRPRPAEGVPAAGAPASVRYHPSALKLLVGLAVLTLAANLAFFLVLRGIGGQVVAPHTGQSTGVTLISPAGDGRLLAATLANQVLLIEDGRPVQTYQASSVIGGAAMSAGRDVVYVGTADSKVTVLDASLRPTAEVPVSGRIVGLQAVADGFLVAHGIGAFSDRYFVSHYAPGTDKATFVRRVEFTISELDVLADMIVYATANARVAALTARGEPLWEVTVRRPVTSLLSIPTTGHVLVGDDRGNLTLVDRDGNVIWETNVTPHPVRSLGIDPPTFTLLAGDSQGTLYALDATGRLLLSRPVAASSLEAFVPAAAGTLIAVPRDGAWLTLTPAAIQGAAFSGGLRLAWFIADALLLALLALTGIAAVERSRAGARGLAGRVWRSRIAYAFVLPSIVLILLFSYYPAALAFYYSLTNFSLRTVPQFVGLDNFVAILTRDFYFRIGAVNMVILLITALIKVLTVPLLVAELVFWLKNHVHRYVFRTLFVFPAVVPSLVTTLLWRLFYEPNAGLFNQILRAVGLGHLQRAWLGDEATALWAIVGAGFPFVGIFAFLIYFGGLLNISAELYDAAQIDGATWWARFWMIDVPLLSPQFRLLLFFAFAGSLQGFANIWIFTRGGPGYATYVPALQMYSQIAEAGEFGYASAIGVILFAVVLAGSLVILRARRPAVE
jgi:ABC-type sugar transport system permease subunit/outer membrane protein assembly factor BamB